MQTAVTLVSGLPRSGTSLMMQMLAAGGLPVQTDALRAQDEDNPRGYFELEAVKQTRRDPSWLRDAPGRAVKAIHLLLTELPPGYIYRVVFMRRPLDEVLRSQRAMLERSGRAGPVLFADRLGDALVGQVAQIRAWLDRQPNFSVLDVEYHDCLREPLTVTARVNAFLGGVLDERAMAEAVDCALYRQRRVAAVTGVRARCVSLR